MEKPKAHRCRKPAAKKPKRAPTVDPLLTPWKRVAAAAAFGLGGGGCAYWGIHDLVVFIGDLHGGALVVETQSAMPGLPLMGIALLAIGVLFLVPVACTSRFLRVQERMAIVILISMLVGIVLSLVGGPIISAVMAGFDYRSCEVRHGRRMTFVTWAARGSACPLVEDDR